MSLKKRLMDHFVPHQGNAFRPHALRRGWLLFLLAIVLATEGFLVASLVARQSDANFLAAVIAGDLISLTNEQRAENKAPTLTENKVLDAAAQAKADDMAAKGYFAHVGPDGKQPWDWIEGAGYDYQYAGENLAVRFVDSKDVVNAWMASPTHRANIVKTAYREIGIGIADGTYRGAPATFVVQYFGSPAGHVLGAEAGPSEAPLQSAVRSLPKVLGDPRESANWVLGGVALLVVVLLILAFFFHMQVQSSEMLLPGVAVAAIALFFLAFNGTFLSMSGSGQAAGAALGIHGGGVVIDQGAASTVR